MKLRYPGDISFDDAVKENVLTGINSYDSVSDCNIKNCNNSVYINANESINDVLLESYPIRITNDSVSLVIFSFGDLTHRYKDYRDNHKINCEREKHFYCNSNTLSEHQTIYHTFLVYTQCCRKISINEDIIRLTMVSITSSTQASDILETETDEKETPMLKIIIPCCIFGTMLFVSCVISAVKAVRDRRRIKKRIKEKRMKKSAKIHKLPLIETNGDLPLDLKPNGSVPEQDIKPISNGSVDSKGVLNGHTILTQEEDLDKSVVRENGLINGKCVLHENKRPDLNENNSNDIDGHFPHVVTIETPSASFKAIDSITSATTYQEESASHNREQMEDDKANFTNTSGHENVANYNGSDVSSMQGEKSEISVENHINARDSSNLPDGTQLVPATTEEKHLGVDLIHNTTTQNNSIDNEPNIASESSNPPPSYQDVVVTSNEDVNSTQVHDPTQNTGFDLPPPLLQESHQSATSESQNCDVEFPPPPPPVLDDVLQ